MSISICIPSKNNLRYLKTCIPSIQQNAYHKDIEIIVFVDQDNDGSVEWLKSNNITHIINQDAEPKGIGYAYDTMFKAAKNDLVVAFHADMVLGYQADLWMKKYKKKDNIVCATRIEPPLHPPGHEKIVADFGMWPEDIDMQEFNEEVRAFIPNFKLTKGMFAPWMIEKSQHLGHDPMFKSVYEDADLFRRFVLAGYKMVQTWDALVYHFTCRGGQFAGAEKMEDFQKKDDKWMSNNVVSMREYIRKWGGLFKEYGPCEPKPNKKYNIGLDLKGIVGIDTHAIHNIEPFFDVISTDYDTERYVSGIQPETSFDMKSKFESDPYLCDIVIKPVNSNFAMIDIEEMMEKIKEPGEYQDSNIYIKVNKIEVRNPQIKLKW
jgi:glycosyltransferase involved in cell wall biosynthesis